MSYVINTSAQLKPILVGFRKSMGMSQKDIADKLNVSQQAYQALESNPQSVTLDRLMKVLNALGVKMYLSDSELNASFEKAHTRKNDIRPDFVINKPDGSHAMVEVKTKNAPSNNVTKKLNKDSW
ncbi:MAG: HTH-type transcriptional regulator/antitoxin HipB [Alteromonadaceae bacterium]|jgi:HTH-type transcriptional regulator/antitoxin HipB